MFIRYKFLALFKNIKSIVDLINLRLLENKTNILGFNFAIADWVLDFSRLSLDLTTFSFWLVSFFDFYHLFLKSLKVYLNQRHHSQAILRSYLIQINQMSRQRVQALLVIEIHKWLDHLMVTRCECTTLTLWLSKIWKLLNPC